VLLLCESADERVALRWRVLRGDGGWRDRVGLRALDQQVSSLLSMLGFTPVDRGRLGVAEVAAVSSVERFFGRDGGPGA
jgi:hypothetical protein